MPKRSARADGSRACCRRKGNVKTAVIQCSGGCNMKLEQADWWRPLPKAGGADSKRANTSGRGNQHAVCLDYLCSTSIAGRRGNTTEADGEMIYIDQGASWADKKHGHCG